MGTWKQQINPLHFKEMMDLALFPEGRQYYYAILFLSINFFFFITDRGLEVAEAEAILDINLTSSSSRMVEGSITILHHQGIINMNQMAMVKKGLSRNSL